MPRFKDRTGNSHGRLTVVSHAGKDTEHGYFRIAETRIAEAYSNTQTKESDT